MAIKECYQKKYKIRKVGSGGFEFCVPKLILERAATREGLSLDEFLTKFEVTHLFNNFEGFDGLYRFDRIKDNRSVIEVPEV